MRIQNIGSYNVTFGYSNELKTLFKSGKLKVEYGFYGDKLTKENASLEHIVPHSKGGKTETNNLALASKRMNNLRGNRDLKEVFNKEAFERYLSYFKDVKIKNFDGNKYIKALRKLVFELLSK